MRIGFILMCLLFIAGCEVRPEYKKYKTYEPTLSSIRTHECPEWYKDAKFGMFIDYGLYSVAGWAPPKENGAMYPDWYVHNMYQVPEWKAYHEKTWGAEFQRDDFIPMFTAENFDPQGLVQLAADCGVKYIVPFCKHHDGFCLWPSSYTERDAMDMGPRKDLIRPLVQACTENDLKFGFYFSIEEWEYPILGEDSTLLTRLWSHYETDEELVPYDEKMAAGMMSGKKPVHDFFGDYIIPQAKEFIDNYDPDLLWFDGEWRTPIDSTRTPEIVSYYYNQAAGRKKVASNDRLGESIRFKVGDFYTSEYHSLDSEQPKILHKWEECRGISQSFGYNWQDTEENIISADEFINMFVRIVSENGNLLLIVNLDGKGALPDFQKKRLHEIGAWLNVNGEAIYATKPWLVAHEGEHLRFTQSKDEKFVYAICTQWPEDEVVIESVYLDTDAQVEMLGTEEHLPWRFADKKLHITIPESVKRNRPCDHAWVLKMEL